MSLCTGQVHTASSRTGTSFILQIGQSPGDDSTTSGCIGHVIDTGGRLTGAGFLPRCALSGAVITQTSEITANARRRVVVRGEGLLITCVPDCTRAMVL